MIVLYVILYLLGVIAATVLIAWLDANALNRGEDDKFPKFFIILSWGLILAVIVLGFWFYFFKWIGKPFVWLYEKLYDKFNKIR